MGHKEQRLLSKEKRTEDTGVLEEFNSFRDIRNFKRLETLGNMESTG